MKDIKRRIKSVGSTRQITKAMELVSSSKLRKAKTRAEQGRPYFEALYHTMCEIASANTDFSTVFTQKRPIKLVASAHENDAEKPKIIAIGKKAIEFFSKRGYEIVGSFANVAEDIKPSKAQDIMNIALDMFKKGEVDDVQLFYTTFVSSLTQEPQQMAVLPMKTQKLENYGTMTYDPSPEAVFNRIVPRFTASLLQCAIVESYASEQGARRTAMESATDNADEMIASLSLLYNRARQASITQELTEIVGGANALE